MNVDAIQSANLVRVVGDQGYAALFADLRLNRSAHARDFDRTSNTAQDTRRRGRPNRPLAGLPCRELRGAGWAATIRRVHASTAASPSVSHSRATIGPAKRTLTTQRTPSGRRLAVPTSRPPPLAATGSFGLTCRTATGITEPTVRCVVYIHSFPTTSRTQEGGFSAQRDMSSCSGRLHHGGPGWGP